MRRREEAQVTGPAWLAAPVAAVMLLIAACCAVRLGISRARGRATEVDADGLHLLMGVAMAGMLEPRLDLVPGIAWQAMFAAAAAWFGWQAIRVRRRRPDRWRCAHPAPHAIECAAMVYMLLPARSAGQASAMAMPGMSAPAAAGSNPAIALVLALFMLGYVFWTTDRIAALSRARPAAANGVSGVAVPVAAAAERDSGTSALGAAHALPTSFVGRALAPRFAACYKIAMSIAMGYMLITMV
jgi:hypothetical protein